MQSGRKSAKPSGTVVERPLPTLGVNSPAGKPQIRNNVHYRYENASHSLFIGVRRVSSLKKWLNSSNAGVFLAKQLLDRMGGFSRFDGWQKAARSVPCQRCS